MLRKNKYTYITICLILLSDGYSAFSYDGIGNVHLGLEYARRNCSTCHAVLRTDLNSPNQKSAPFTMIANTPGITRTSLGVFLQTPHSTMPNLIIQDADADNLIAYILSLKSDALQKAQ